MSIFETHVWESPQLPFIFNHMTLHPDHKISGANWHENIELIYVLEGSGIFWCEGEQTSLLPGDLVCISSNNIHDVSTNNRLSYHYLIVDRSFCLANHFDTNKMHLQKNKFRDDYLITQLQVLLEAYQQPKDTPFRVQEIRSIVLGIMTHLGRFYSTPVEGSESSHLTSCFQQAIAYIRQNYKNPALSLEEVAEFVGLSKYYFAHKFKQLTKHTCVWYINMMRCAHAKDLLADTDMKAGEIAQICGFNSHSYFTRTFHDYIGVSPEEYRLRS